MFRENEVKYLKGKEKKKQKKQRQGSYLFQVEPQAQLVGMLQTSISEEQLAFLSSQRSSELEDPTTGTQSLAQSGPSNVVHAYV